MAANPYSNVSISGYNLDAPTDDGAQTANNRVTWAKQKTKLADPLKVAIEAIDNATDDAFAAVAAILVDFTGDFGSGGITGLVPAPGAGDAANNRFLRADGTWTTPAGAGSVTSVATGSGLTGGPITGAGTISLASIANNAVMGNLTGLTAAPSAVLLPALLNALDVFQGDLGSGGVKGLVPAPAADDYAKFLRGDGTWAATVDNFSGTVTSIATGTGLTGGTITGSGTISLAAINDQTLLVNLSGGSAAPTEHNISELTPYLQNVTGDFGSGGAKGLVPAPAAGDASKVLYGDGTWQTPPGATAGEANTASNLGSGAGLYASKSGVDLRFKSLVAGTGVSLSSDSTTVTITASSPSSFIGDGGSGGVSGLVPAPAAGDDYKYLKGNGAWGSGFRIGEIIMWPLATAPAGTLECAGTAVSRSTYANLFAVIGTTYGVGDGSTTFNLPDYRGEFLRGWAHGSTNDPDRASRTDAGGGGTGDNIGTKQASDYLAHTHTTGLNVLNTTAVGGASGRVTGSGSSITPSTSTSPATGGNETRPRNVNIMFCIAYE